MAIQERQGYKPSDLGVNEGVRQVRLRRAADAGVDSGE
jgi:hypothetical protein